MTPTCWKSLGSGRQTRNGALSDSRLMNSIKIYKRDIAGAYSSITIDDVGKVLQNGPCLVSPKIDGMTAFLHRQAGETVVITPSGQLLADLPFIQEMDNILGDWEGLLAGELYAIADTGRPTIYSLLSALGGGETAPVERLRFAAFDVLLDGAENMQSLPYEKRATYFQTLLMDGKLAHAVPVTLVQNSTDILNCYQLDVINANGEGLVIHAGDGRIFKLKPVIILDAVVVGYTSHDIGITDLLIGLMPVDQPDLGMKVQLIGRVDVGFTDIERKQLAARLAPLQQPSALVLTNRAGRPYQWVTPQLVVEVRCHELLTIDQDGLPILRWQITADPNTGWTPNNRIPGISMRDAVFVRIRDDKEVTHQAVRWSQVTDIVPIASLPLLPAKLPPAEVIRRNVYTRSLRGGGKAVRKIMILAPHIQAVDAGYPPYIVVTTDYSPDRQEPLRNGLQVAGTLEVANQLVDNWLDHNTGRGWHCVATHGETLSVKPDHDLSKATQSNTAHTLTIACTRSSSPTFPIVRKRLDALAELGTLTVTTNEQGREVWFELTVGDLVASYRRIANLLAMVRRWKTCEISLDGEVLDKVAVDDLLNRLEEIRRCWQRRHDKGTAGCRQSCALGCDQLILIPSERYLQAAATREPDWYTVGRFDGSRVTIDKSYLQSQVDRSRNRLVACCPNFNKQAVAAAIDALPDTLVPDNVHWQIIYHREDGRPAWVWPVHTPLPPRLAERGLSNATSQSQDTGITLGNGQVQRKPIRQLPSAKYSDVCGQEEAVAAVRELIELPLHHAAYFTAIGSRPQPGGVILAGPPGTGKTLLARAVAAECGAHLEIIAGPEILSQWVGGSEQALRDIFTRAEQQAPSLILIDELDSIASARSHADAQHQQSLVAQLLVLLDGLESRRQVCVLATTNRPKAIDPALRRHGRFDRVVWMRPPDINGRAAILRHHLGPLRLAEQISRDELVVELAGMTDGASGADLAYICQSAARCCVQDAVQAGLLVDDVYITDSHLQRSLRVWLADQAQSRH
jgi:AAA+ superfamily predicted ATPase